MSNLNDHFERIYVLNLPYKPDRKERLERQLTSLGLARNVTWMRAYSGAMMPCPGWWNAGDGAWGCLLSHARVVEEAIMDKLASFLVLEDDAVVQPNARDMLARDWDQLYLGGQHLRAPMPVADKPLVLRAWNVNRTHAFALRDKVFARYHQHIWHAPDYMSKSGGWHIDHQLGLAQERGDWTVYTPLWWLAGQDADWSNISGRQNPRLWWHPSRHAVKLPFIHLPPAQEPDLGPLSELLHAGNTLKPGTLEDVGLDAAAENDEALRNWLKMIAREALDMGRLPCWQHRGISVERVRESWPAGVEELYGADIPRLADYIGKV